MPYFTRATTCVALALMLLAGTARIVGAQAPQDVPREHWAYTAVDDLARKGLIKGYPPSGDFFGKRTVTRYEMAVILQRVLSRVDELLSNKADKGANNAVKPEQLDEVRRLVAEYRTELTVIGTDLQKVKDQIGDLTGKVDAAQRTANEAKDAASKAAADAAAAAGAAADAKQGVQGAIDAIGEQKGRIDTLNAYTSGHRLGGYLQARFESFDQGQTSLFSKTGAGGTGQNPSTGGPSVGGPYYGFQVRRARLKLSGNITPRTDYAVQIDLPSSGGLNVKDAYVNILDAPFKGINFTAGQFLTPFGLELNESSASRWAPERSMAFSDSGASASIWRSNTNAVGGTLTPGSVLPLFLNQEYDAGAMLTWYPRLSQRSDRTISEDRKTKVQLAVINGEGTAAGGIRNQNNDIDVVGRVQTGLLGNKLGVGVSGYLGTTAVRGGAPVGGTPVSFVNAQRQFFGADVSYFTPWKTELRGEYVAGIQETTPDRAQYLQGNHVQGFYLQARHPFTSKLDLVAKYEEFMPISQAGKSAAGLGRIDLTRKAAHLGILYYMDSQTRFRLWYEKALTPFDPSVGAGPFRSRLGFITGEIQVRY